MSAFPDYPPTDRRYVHGDWPTKRHRFMSNDTQTMLFGTAKVAQELRLIYANQSTEQISRFLCHYDTVAGDAWGFGLPNSVAAGWTGGKGLIGLKQTWRYKTVPRVTSNRGLVSTLEITLVTTPDNIGQRFLCCPPTGGGGGGGGSDGGGGGDPIDNMNPDDSSTWPTFPAEANTRYLFKTVYEVDGKGTLECGRGTQVQSPYTTIVPTSGFTTLNQEFRFYTVKEGERFDVCSGTDTLESRLLADFQENDGSGWTSTASYNMQQGTFVNGTQYGQGANNLYERRTLKYVGIEKVVNSGNQGYVFEWGTDPDTTRSITPRNTDGKVAYPSPNDPDKCFLLYPDKLYKSHWFKEAISYQYQSCITGTGCVNEIKTASTGETDRDTSGLGGKPPHLIEQTRFPTATNTDLCMQGDTTSEWEIYDANGTNIAPSFGIGRKIVSGGTSGTFCSDLDTSETPILQYYYDVDNPDERIYPVDCPGGGGGGGDGGGGGGGYDSYPSPNDPDKCFYLDPTKPYRSKWEKAAVQGNYGTCNTETGCGWNWPTPITIDPINELSKLGTIPHRIVSVRSQSDNQYTEGKCFKGNTNSSWRVYAADDSSFSSLFDRDLQAGGGASGTYCTDLNTEEFPTLVYYESESGEKIYPQDCPGGGSGGGDGGGGYDSCRDGVSGGAPPVTGDFPDNDGDGSPSYPGGSPAPPGGDSSDPGDNFPPAPSPAPGPGGGNGGGGGPGGPTPPGPGQPTPTPEPTPEPLPELPPGEYYSYWYHEAVPNPYYLCNYSPSVDLGGCINLRDGSYGETSYKSRPGPAPHEIQICERYEDSYVPYGPCVQGSDATAYNVYDANGERISRAPNGTSFCGPLVRGTAGGTLCFRPDWNPEDFPPYILYYESVETGERTPWPRPRSAKSPLKVTREAPQPRATKTSTKFPAYKPSSRTYSLGDTNVKRFSSISGQNQTLPLSSKAIHNDAELQLNFANRGDGVARAILKHFHAHKGRYDDFKLPEAIFKDWNKSMASGKWRYAAPPQVQTTHIGTSTTSVRLISTGLGCITSSSGGGSGIGGGDSPSSGPGGGRPLPRPPGPGGGSGGGGTGPSNPSGEDGGGRVKGNKWYPDPEGPSEDVPYTAPPGGWDPDNVYPGGIDPDRVGDPLPVVPECGPGYIYDENQKLCVPIGLCNYNNGLVYKPVAIYRAYYIVNKFNDGTPDAISNYDYYGFPRVDFATRYWNCSGNSVSPDPTPTNYRRRMYHINNKWDTCEIKGLSTGFGDKAGAANCGGNANRWVGLDFPIFQYAEFKGWSCCPQSTWPNLGVD